MSQPNQKVEIIELANSIPVYVPVLTIQKYAEAIGVTEETVLGWVNRGYIATVKIGKRRLVNIAAMTREFIP